MRRALIVCGMLVAVGSVAWSAPSAGDLLRAALRGPRVAYHGVQRTKVVTESGTIEADVAVRCNGKGATRREYCQGCAAGCCSLQVGWRTWQRMAGAWTVLPPPAERNPDEAARWILRNYTVTDTAGGMIAGRQTRKITAQPRYSFCPARVWWLDVSSGTVLRDDLRSPEGQLRSSSAYILWHAGPQSPALFAVPATSSASAAYGPSTLHKLAGAADALRITGIQAPAPKHVPAGFRATMWGYMDTRNGRKMPAVHYSDGLAAFTIFRRGPGAGGMGRHGNGMGPGGGRGWRGGAGQASSVIRSSSTRQNATVELARPGAGYLLVGDIAESELRKVAESLP